MDNQQVTKNRDDAKLMTSTEVRHLWSEQLGQEFRIFVALPEPLVPDQTYPVLYVLDGNNGFGLATDTARLLQMGMELPALMVVGVGYPVETFTQTMGLRTRDYTPTPDPRFVGLMSRMWNGTGEDPSGRGPEFLDFLKTGLKPFIESEYPADPTDATLFGDSFGGLFGIFTLFHAPDTFQRYILGSPSLWWDGQVILDHEREYASDHDDLAATVFMACGSLENARDMVAHWRTSGGPELENFVEEYLETVGKPQLLELMQPFVDSLRGRGYPSLELTSEVFPSETHHSVVGINLSRGLRQVFRKGWFGAP